VQAARSSEIYFPVENGPSNVKSKYDPDASFWHDEAQYPGVIIEVAYSQKRRLDRLAEDYLMDSDASVRVVVGLDVKSGKRGTSEATLSVWRTSLFPTADGEELELRVVKEVADQVFAALIHSCLFSTPNIFPRRSVIDKETLHITQVYNFTYPTLLARSLQKM
jgi:hypothetical protein